MEEILRLRFLGAVEVERGGELVCRFESRKALALLGYLAVQGDRSVPRTYLVDLLWEDKAEARGRANLSWALHKISTELPGCLKADRHSLQFQRTVSYWLDIDAFAELEAQGDPASLAAAMALYRGEFMEGLCLRGCAEFEIWLAGERERWRQRVARVLRKVVVHYSQRGAYEQGLRFARQLLTLEPWREEGHQHVMRLLFYSGQRGAALAQYEACRRILAEELDTEPSEETKQLYQQIRHGELVPPVLTVDWLPPIQVLPPHFREQEGRSSRPVFVAREAELTRLQKFLDAALAGHGRTVFVVGDAGRGKTALIREFVRRALVAHADLIVAGGSSHAYTGVGDPYLPFREILGLLTGDFQSRWAMEAISAEQAGRLWHGFPLTVQTLIEAGPDLIGTFLSPTALFERTAAAAPSGAPWLSQLERLVACRTAIPGRLPPQQGALFEQYSRVVDTLGRQNPLLLILDDLQWADRASISLLFHLGRHLEGCRALIVGAYRPEEIALGREGERHPLAAVVNEFKGQSGDIVVDLEQAQGRPFLEAFLDSEPNRLEAAFRDTLYRQTGGHPLFTIELLRGMQDRGDLVLDEQGYWVEGPALDWETLPVRVEAVIAERVGRLPESLQDVLRVVSVEGEIFTAEVLAQVRAADPSAIVGCLSGDLERIHRLVSNQGIQRRPSSGLLSHYRFRHILFQRYLYNSLSEAERCYLHEAVGKALEALYQKETEEIAVQLAWHFQEAGKIGKAIVYLLQAGERAVRMSANVEAVDYFERGLTLFQTVLDIPERARQELALQAGLAVALQSLKGPGAPEAGRAYARAWELCQQVGESPQLVPVLWALALFYGSHGDHEIVQQIVEQLLHLAECAQDPLAEAMAHWMVGINTFVLGEFAVARTHLEHTIDFYDVQQHRDLGFLYGYDPGVYSLSMLALTLWLLGYPKQALQRTREALALAHELSHLPSLILGNSYASTVYGYYRDWPATQRLAEMSMHLAIEQGFSYWQGVALDHHGWALAHQGQVEEGIAQIHQGIAAHRAAGGEAFLMVPYVYLAEAHEQVGQVQAGLDALAEARAIVERTGEHFFDAEILRLQGKLLHMQGADPAEVERYYRQAVALAGRQQAKAWELRAATSLARLWQTQGRHKEARQVLSQVCNWFTEGLDTPDLQEAYSLLETLV